MLGPLQFLLLVPVLSSTLYPQIADSCGDTSVPVTVLDGHGVPIGNLTKENFKASHRGKALKINTLQYRNSPGGRVVVLLDVSGSMRSDSAGPNKWKIAREAALQFVSSLPPETRVSFLAFSSGIRQRFEGSMNKEPIEAWLNQPTVQEGKEAKGDTALYDAIREALKDLDPRLPGDAIYVITDGQDGVSGERQSELEKSLQSSRVRLFAFLLNDPQVMSPNRPNGQDLYELVRGSGGFLVGVSPHPFGAAGPHLYATYDYGENTIKAIRASTRMLQSQICCFYALDVQSPNDPGKPPDWKVDIVTDSGVRRKEATVTYPSKLAPAECTAQRADRQGP